MKDTASIINEYISSLPERKATELLGLHHLISGLMPGCKLWFLDGKNSENKVVSNPNIGYGSYQIKYANGTSREFYRIGLSANSTGISVYIMGLDDKTLLARRFGKDIGKATITGYCIKFRSVSDINTDTLIAAIKYGAAYKSGDYTPDIYPENQNLIF